VGTRLFMRASMHCRNADVDTLYMHCLSSNKVMMHIAKKAGMEIHRDYGEADAYLKIKPANSATVFRKRWKSKLPCGLYRQGQLQGPAEMGRARDRHRCQKKDDGTPPPAA
jgi:hypothetical protein